MTQKLLITGGSGFIGRHCLAPAIAAGFEVWATASKDIQPELQAINKNIKWKKIDLLHPGAIEYLLNEIKPTHLLHTAWETAHGSYWTSPANLEWLAFGTRLFKSFAKNGGERLVCAGTCAEYDWDYGYMVEGLTPEKSASFYGKIKQAHHLALMAAGQQLNFSAATGRVFFVYGPYENLNRIVPYTFRQLQKNEPAEFGSGKLYRDFLYVADVAAGLIALLQSSIEGPCNISSAIPCPIADIVMSIGRISQQQDLIHLNVISNNTDQPYIIVGDNKNLISTGWSPSYSLHEGLLQTYRWFQINNMH